MPANKPGRLQPGLWIGRAFLSVTAIDDANPAGRNELLHGSRPLPVFNIKLQDKQGMKPVKYGVALPAVNRADLPRP